VLVAATIARCAIFLEITVVGVALPALVRDFDTTPSRVAWTVTAYTLALAAAVVPLGRLGDRIGHRKLLLWSMTALIAASVACALSPGITFLLVARVVQGLAAAALLPSTQAIVAAAYEGAARTKALGQMVGFQALVFASGPIIGGLLIAGPGWRWVFLVITPFSLLGLLLIWREVPVGTHNSGAANLAVVPSLLLAASATAITLAGVEARDLGPTFAGTSAAVAVALAVAFVIVDRRSSAPLLDPRLIRRRRYLSGLTGGFLYQFGMLASSVVLLSYFQLGLGFSAQRAGLAFIPVSLPLLAAGSVVAPLVTRVGALLPLLTGLTCMGGGFALSGVLAASESYWAMIPALLLIGVGIALTVTPLQVLAVGEMPEDVRGLAGGGLSLVRQIGGAIGVATLTTVLAAAENHHVRGLLGGLSRAAADDLEGLLADREGATAALASLPDATRRTVIGDAVQTQTVATRISLITGGAIIIAGMLLVAALLRGTRPEPTAGDAALAGE